MNILLVQTGFLGDVVLSTPLIHNLRLIYPDSKISVLTTPLAKDLVSHHPELYETLVFDKRGSQSGLSGILAMATELRQRKFSIVFSLHKSWRTIILLLLAGIPKRYGFREAAVWWAYSKVARRKDLPHEVLRNLAILRTIEKEPENLEQKLCLQIPEGAIAEVDQLFVELKNNLEFDSHRSLIGIAPGSVWATKRWTVNGFVAVTEELFNQGYQVVLIGGKSDENIAHEIVSRCKTPVINLVAKTSLIVSAEIIRRCTLIISNDSAPLHIASACGVPVIAIFCATVPEFGYGPWQVPSIVLGVSGLSCRPCGLHGGNTCPTGTHACQLGITPAQVLAAVRQMMKNIKQLAV